jgi:hypothetical protein
MIRLLLPLAIAPTLTACDIDVFGKNTESREAYLYRQSIISPPSPIQKPLQSTESPVQTVSPSEPTTVAEIEPIAVPEPVYVPPEPKPTCMPVHMIVACGPNGETILLET